MFDPKLRAGPVVVLSNNDGCAIARTSEAKALGIRMGEPFFKMRELCRSGGVRVFSSNYALYGDMSARTNAIYRQFAPDVEVYSIDESFLDLSSVRAQDRVPLGRDLRATVLRWTGIPTCVGIGPTKTLAKLANHIAKHEPEMAGVCDLTDPVERARWLSATKLEEVWGIGPASARKLRALGCDTVADVAALDPRPTRKALTVVGERMIYELRGLPCLDLESVTPTRKGCAVTRSFSSRVEDRDTMESARVVGQFVEPSDSTDRRGSTNCFTSESLSAGRHGRSTAGAGARSCRRRLEQAIATHAARLGEKLRRGSLGTDHLTVFFHTSEHDTGSPQRSVSSVVTLPEATSDTMVLIKAAISGMRRVWRDGYRYEWEPSTGSVALS